MHLKNHNNVSYDNILCYTQIDGHFLARTGEILLIFFHIFAKFDVSKDGKWPENLDFPFFLEM